MKKVREEKNCIVYENKLGNVKIVHFALAFGEPQKSLQILFSKPNGYHETERHLTPDEAIQFALDLIEIAKKVKEKIIAWETKGVPAY